MENEWIATDVDDEDEADLGYSVGLLEFNSPAPQDYPDRDTAINAAIVASWDDHAYGVWENETDKLLCIVFGQMVFIPE